MVEVLYLWYISALLAYRVILRPSRLKYYVSSFGGKEEIEILFFVTRPVPALGVKNLIVSKDGVTKLIMFVEG